MRSYLKNYRGSFAIIAVVTYLSFFRPPETGLDEFPGFDKWVHFCMYLGMSGMLWYEFWRCHRNKFSPLWRAWRGAFLCPLIFSGGAELIQEFVIPYRTGDWYDFGANALGIVLASFIGYLFLSVSTIAHQSTKQD